MFPQHDDIEQRTRRRSWSATVALIVLNVIAFFIQKGFLLRPADEDYFALSLPGLQHGHVWQLLTYQFMHGNLPHLLLNCWALFVFGRGVEWAMGKTRFLIVYFASGIIGGLLQVMACFLWPHYFYGAMVGASAGVFGVVASFAMLFPEQPLVMLLFFVIPMKMRAKSLIGFTLCLTGLGIAFPQSRLALLLGGNVAHFAHLGGILTGLAFSRFYFLRILRTPPPFSDPL